MNLHRLASLVPVFALTLLVAGPAPSDAAEITVRASAAVRTVVQDLIPKFEKATGHKVLVEYGVANAIAKQLAGGEAFDLVVLPNVAMDVVAQGGRLVSSSRTSLARLGVAVGIRKGGRHYDMSTVDAFKRMLLDVKSIAYAEVGTSGVYFAGLLKQLGLDETLKPKLLILPTGDEVGKALTDGRAEICILPASEILPLASAEVLAQLPDAIQSPSRAEGAISVAAKQAAAAQEFLSFLASPANRATYVQMGLVP